MQNTHLFLISQHITFHTNLHLICSGSYAQTTCSIIMVLQDEYTHKQSEVNTQGVKNFSLKVLYNTFKIIITHFTVTTTTITP
jgi:hypothetical protein